MFPIAQYRGKGVKTRYPRACHEIELCRTCCRERSFVLLDEEAAWSCAQNQEKKPTRTTGATVVRFSAAGSTTARCQPEQKEMKRKRRKRKGSFRLSLDVTRRWVACPFSPRRFALALLVKPFRCGLRSGPGGPGERAQPAFFVLDGGHCSPLKQHQPWGTGLGEPVGLAQPGGRALLPQT